MPGKGKGKNGKNKRVISSGNSSVEQQGGITKINLEEEQTIPTGKVSLLKVLLLMMTISLKNNKI